jgi:hypothetical protein
MSAILCDISKQFWQKSEGSTLCLEKKDNGSYAVSVEEKFSTLTIKPTWDCIKEIFGENRLNRITQHPIVGLDQSHLLQNRLALSKCVARNLFMGLMDIQIQDLRPLAEDSSVEHTYKKLIFFNSMTEVMEAMMGAHLQPMLIDHNKTVGKGFEGFVECIYILMQHHFASVKEQNKKAAELRDIEMLTSRFADREIREGSVAHLSEGYFYVDKVFKGGGAYIYLLQDVEERQIPKLLCRGTARPPATEAYKSSLNDVLLEIGSMGVKETWPMLSNYLKEKKITSLDILGKSLGGAFAQHFAVLIEGVHKIKVNKLITCASVGVGRSINTVFKKEILPNRESPFTIQLVRNGGSRDRMIDFIPALGGVHLGEGTSPEKCDVEVSYIQPTTNDRALWKNPVDFSLFAIMHNFLSTLGYGHRRQTTLQDFIWKKIEDRSEVDEHLRLGNKLETLRKCVAYVLHFFTFFRLNGLSMAAYFYTQKTKKQ